MCTHDFFIFSTCGHVFISPQPVQDCPLRCTQANLQAQHALNRQRQLATQARGRTQTAVGSSAEQEDKEPSDKPLPAIPSVRTLASSSQNLQISRTPGSNNTAVPGIILGTEADLPCSKTTQHPYRSHLIHRLCMQCTSHRQRRLRTISSSGLMQGITVDEGRWRVRLEGKRQSIQERKDSRGSQSAAGMGMAATDAAVQKKMRKRGLQELRLPMRVAELRWKE